MTVKDRYKLILRDLFIIGRQDISEICSQRDFNTIHALEAKYKDPNLFLFMYGYICGKRAERARRQGRSHK